jgi:uncharacterized protein (TIGR03437 family)
LHEEGAFPLLFPFSVKAEIEHPNTPADVKHTTVTIGGLNAIVAWSGLSSEGTYQLNVIVPEGLARGDALVVATTGSVQSQGGIFIPVQ